MGPFGMAQNPLASKLFSISELHALFWLEPVPHSCLFMLPRSHFPAWGDGFSGTTDNIFDYVFY